MDLSVTDHLLTSTRSVRKRLTWRAVDPAVVQECLRLQSGVGVEPARLSLHGCDRRGEVAR